MGIVKEEARKVVEDLPEEATWWQSDFLDERLASVDSEEGRDWEDVKAEIWPASR